MSSLSLNTLIDYQARGEFQKLPGGGYHLSFKKQELDLPDFAAVTKKVEELFGNAGTVHLSNPGKTSIRSIHFDPLTGARTFVSRRALRNELSREKGGAWVEQRGKNLTYWIKGNEVSKEEFERYSSEGTLMGRIGAVGAMALKALAITQLLKLPFAKAEPIVTVPSCHATPLEAATVATCPTTITPTLVKPYFHYTREKYVPDLVFHHDIDHLRIAICEMGVDPNERHFVWRFEDESLLERATDHAHKVGVDSLRALLYQGAKPSNCDLLRLAESTSKEAVALLLENAQIDPSEPCRDRFQSPPLWKDTFRERSITDFAEIIPEVADAFAEAGYKPTAIDLETALHRGNREIIRLALKHMNPFVKVPGTGGQSHVDYALRSASEETYQAFREELGLSEIEFLFKKYVQYNSSRWGLPYALEALAVSVSVFANKLLKPAYKDLLLYSMLYSAFYGASRVVTPLVRLGGNPLAIIHMNGEPLDNHSLLDVALLRGHQRTFFKLHDLGARIIQATPEQKAAFFHPLKIEKEAEKIAEMITVIALKFNREQRAVVDSLKKALTTRITRFYAQYLAPGEVLPFEDIH